MAPLKILFVAPECAPFAKTGGLGDVVGALPRALARRGLDVKVVMPLYGGMPWHELEALEGAVDVPTWYGVARAGVRMGRLPRSAVPVYFLEYHRYFDRPWLYGRPGEGYDDNLERFAFLSRGALELCKAIAFQPDVIHANDWQAALAPVYVDTVEWARPLHAAATVFTIHNMAHQGIIDVDYAEQLGIPTGPLLEVERSGRYPGKLNLMARAISAADIISTVSPRYAREIMTSEYGAGLDGLLRSRAEDVVGILNGIDTETFDPERDPALPARFSLSDRSGKVADKAALQHELGLETSLTTPLIGVVSRLDDQKGFDLILAGFEQILALGVQLAVLGTGAPEYHAAFTRLAEQYSGRLAARLAFDAGLAQRIYAGSDMFLMPSRFEPCGLGQMIAMRYGTVPIVRATGGLADTVSEEKSDQNGFTFVEYDVDALIDAVARAVAGYHDPRRWETIVTNGMRRDVSWDRAAGEYLTLYRRAMAARDARIGVAAG
jgi:starch synthase